MVVWERIWNEPERAGYAQEALRSVQRITLELLHRMVTKPGPSGHALAAAIPDPSQLKCAIAGAHAETSWNTW